MEFRQLDPTDQELMAQTRRLVDSSFQEFFKSPYWEWKYHDPHSAQQSLSFVALDGGEVVAALHYHRTTLMLGVHDMPVLVGGDLIVRPDHRGKGLATNLTEFARSTIPQDWRGGAVYMFTRPRLGAHYRELLGYARVPAAAERLIRIRTWEKRLERLGTDGRIADFQERAASAPDSCVEWRIQGAPPLWTVIERGSLRVIDAHLGRVDATVTGRIVAVQRLGKDKGKWRALAGSLQRGEVRASVRPAGVIALGRSVGIHIDAVRAVL